MKIAGNGYEITKCIKGTALSRGKEQTERTSSQGNISSESKGDAIVHLSKASKEVQKAKEVIKSEPDTRLEKVRAIQEEIKRGPYKVNAEKTAEKMLGYFIDEMG